MQVLLTAIGIPRLRKDTMSRGRLMGALREGLSCRHILVVAEAGYGKTTLLTQFASTLDWPVAWYTVTESGRDPVVFLASVLAAIEQAKPGTTFRAHQALRGLTKPGKSWRVVADTLVNDLATLAPDPAMLVFDDVHLVTDSPSEGIPGHLAYHLPAHVHLALISRMRLASPEIARLTGQGEIFTLDSRALAFTAEETAAMLAGATSTPLTVEEAAMAHSRTEGWPAGLQLLKQALGAGGQASILDTIRDFGRDRYELYGYFATQAVDRLPADLRRSLLRISILDVVEPHMCEAITDLHDATKFLRRLEDQGLFLTAVDPQHRSWRLHRLFRDFLRMLLEEEEGEAEVRRLRREAGRVLARAGRAAEAIPYLLAAEEYQEVAALLAAEGERWLREGSGKSVAEWIAALPHAAIESSPHLLMLLGRLADRSGDWEGAFHHYARAEALASGDAAGAARYLQASALFRLHRFAEARQICQEALEVEGLTPGTRARLIRGVASCDLWSGAPAGVIPMFEQALALLQEAGILHDQALVVRELMFVMREVYPEPGWPARLLPQALSLYRQAEHLTMRIDAAQLIGDLLYEQGDFLKALEFLEEAGEGAHLLGDVFRLSLYFLRRGLALLELGRHDEARAVFDEGMRVSQKHQTDQSVFGDTLGLARLARKEGRLAEAATLLRKTLDAHYREHASLFVPGGRVELALAAAEAGALNEAREHLHEAKRRFEEWGAGRRATECVLHLALLDLRNRASRGPGRAVAEALQAARAHGLDDFFLGRVEGAEALLTRALIDGVEVEYVSTVLARRGDAGPLAPLVGHHDRAVRVRAADVLGRIGGEEARYRLDELTRDMDPRVRAHARAVLGGLSRQPSAPLSVRLLGGFEVRKEALLIPPGAWRRRRDRLLLAYLLLAHRPVHREALREALWPGLSPSSAMASLNAAWSNLKRALEPGLPRGLPSDYLVIDGALYGLRKNAIATDVQEFERAVGSAARATTPDTRFSHLEQAVALYRGDLLPEDASEAWTLVERERLRTMYLSALDQLADAHLDPERPQDAIEILRVIVHLEPWREEAYRKLMRALAATGRRSEALYLYRRCEALLRRELGVSPSSETTALFEAMASGRAV